MTENTDNNLEKQTISQEKPVDEQGGFLFSTSIKIHDPNSKEVLVQMRGDN
jgi:hypothetical protein